jgi:outer membrane protein assembly factor BamB
MKAASRPALTTLVLALATLVAGCQPAPGGRDSDWSTYNGHTSGDHFSALTEITRDNVHSLRQVWRTTWSESGDPETNPLIIDGMLYGYTPSLKIVSLDGGTGRVRWTFDAGLRGSSIAPGINFTGPARGLAYWRHGRERRLLAGVMQYLFALDPDTGQPIASFGKDGAADLREGLRGDPAQHYVSLTSPAVVYGDLIIVGFRTSETAPAPPGDIRAFDVRTGALRWRFHTIPHAGEPGSETWPQGAWQSAGAANNWAGMALDEARGIVYVPTGSAVSDFYGADRAGDNLFANTLLALNARSGRRLWHFQGVHHDLWDRDFPAPPVLLTVQRDGREIAAVAQTTKQGYVFLFDRLSGKPPASSARLRFRTCHSDITVVCGPTVCGGWILRSGAVDEQLGGAGQGHGVAVGIVSRGMGWRRPDTGRQQEHAVRGGVERHRSRLRRRLDVLDQFELGRRVLVRPGQGALAVRGEDITRAGIERGRIGALARRHSRQHLSVGSVDHGDDAIVTSGKEPVMRRVDGEP